MSRRVNSTFLVLVLVQGSHSVEEYLGKLWEVFSPAILLTSLVSENLETGFLVINIGLFIFGIWCWFFPVLRNYTFARGLIWFWIVIEIINGIVHTVWTLFERAYTPGIATAPILLILGVYLSRLLLRLDSKALNK